MKIFAILALTRLFSLVHPKVAPVFACPIAFLVWHGSRRLRTVSLKNLELCYPDMPQAERTHLAKRAMFHYARNIIESGIAWHWPKERFNSLFEETVGKELLDEAIARGDGVMVLAPHCGAWELLSLRFTQELVGAILYKPGDDPKLEEQLLKSRQRFGNTLLPANRRGLKGLYGCLERGEVIGMLPDQEPKAGDGRFAPFFGVPALTGVLACRLARRTGAAVIFGVCVRRPRGRYQVHFLPAEPDLWSEDIDAALAALNRGVERTIEVDREQFLWAYKRFRQRPEGEERFY